MLKSAKVATPLVFVVRNRVPDRTPPVGLVPIDTVTDTPGTRFVNASFTVTWTAGEIGALVVVVPGCTVNDAGFR